MRRNRSWLTVLALTATLVVQGGTSTPDAHAESRRPADAERAHQKWLESAARLGDAVRALASWRDGAEAGLAELGEVRARVEVALQVELRRALHAGQRWLTGALEASGLHERLPAPPDLTALRVEPVRGVESSGFGWREDPITGAKKFHKGADYKADRGTPVYAAGDGIVVFRGRQNGYGKVIYIDHGSGVVTRYAHLRDIDVENGQAVRADEPIGEVGSTGRTTGPHLHFEVRIDGRAVCPEVALDVGMMQRTQPAALAWIAAMALAPEAQRERVDAHGPPRDMKAKAGRPERRGRAKRERPTS
jgi:murein DD-endopeptidase MepM/ murein hydrolase activator NlpD